MNFINDENFLRTLYSGLNLRKDSGRKGEQVKQWIDRIWFRRWFVHQPDFCEFFKPVYWVPHSPISAVFGQSRYASISPRGVRVYLSLNKYQQKDADRGVLFYYTESNVGDLIRRHELRSIKDYLLFADGLGDIRRIQVEVAKSKAEEWHLKRPYSLMHWSLPRIFGRPTTDFMNLYGQRNFRVFREGHRYPLLDTEGTHETIAQWWERRDSTQSSHQPPNPYKGPPVQLVSRFDLQGEELELVRLCTAQALREEGEDLGHCVGNYWTGLGTSTWLLSLRKPDGTRLATVEAVKRHEGVYIVQMQGRDDRRQTDYPSDGLTFKAVEAQLEVAIKANHPVLRPLAEQIFETQDEPSTQGTVSPGPLSNDGSEQPAD